MVEKENQKQNQIDEDSLDYQFIKQFEELTKQKQEEDPWKIGTKMLI